VSDGGTSTYGTKGFYFSLDPATIYNVTVTVVARHTGENNLCSIIAPTLGHNEQGGLRYQTDPPYLLIGTEWTSVTFTVPETLTGEYLNSTALNTLLKGAPGNDADMWCEIQGVYITAVKVD
jgi:hypothetical protein